ncbi:MAG: LysM peptidoglycan-binding domain-containing protein [Ilumatobacter sp.]
MSVRTLHRRTAIVAPLLAAGLVASACGGSDSSAASRPTVTLEVGETNYQTIPPASTDAPVPEDAEPELGAEQEYTVQAGDYGILVASKFGVSLEDLSNINGWADPSNEFPGIGAVIRIPAGGTGPADSTTTAGTSADDTATAAEGDVGESIDELGSNCGAGSYTIEAGDTTRIAVANKFDVTVEAMDAANAGTSGYSAFFPGLQIVIPAKTEDC